jgi:serine/threonine protein kinase/tetratricopeptide (TPR) repeat protein
MSEKLPSEPPRPDLASTDAAAVRTQGTGEPTRPGRRHGPRYTPGEHLADFVVEDFIAEGGFGSVYRARHDQLGAVALKVSHIPANELPTECLALQQNELEALIQLRHPSLVRVLDHGSLADHRSYLALELVEGESLLRYMERKGRVDVIEAISLMRRLAEGIAHCHQFEILHLDLTPSNVIVVDAYAPHLKIVDFGVAAFAENWLDVERRPSAGTPRYMAPEMVADPPVIGSHCDVYALGLIFYELLTRRFPFEGATTWDQFLKKRRGEMQPVTAYAPDVPEAIAVTVHALLHPRPTQRGFTAASLGSHLKDLYFDILRRGDAGPHRSARRITEVLVPAAALVGRDDELELLLARGTTALHGLARARSRGAEAIGLADTAGWAVVLSGDPGIGKTRLLAELTQRLELSRVANGYGRCREHGNLVSYGSWRECLGQLERFVARSTHPRADAARAQVRELLADPALADLCVLIPELEALRRPPAGDAAVAPPAPLQDVVGSSRVSQAVRRLITTICAHLPTALVIEDLHWADQGTLDILGALVALPLPPGLLILCTARPEAELPPWAALDRLRLEPFDERRSADLLRSLAGDMSPEVIAQLTAAVPLLRMGNPLVDTQVILHLKREGLLGTNAAGQVVLSERFDRDYEPPTSVSAVLERRLRHVPDRAREVLGIASLIGRQFRISDLKRITAPEIDGRGVDDAVREAVELSLCRADDDDCGFVHDVIRDHFESTVSKANGPDLHARIARTLRRRDTPAATLAYHLDRAGDRAAAAAKYFDGGIDADRVHDLVGSSHNLRRALALYLEIAPSAPRDRDLARTTYELARITCLLGKTHEPLDHLDRARQAMVAPPDDAVAMLDSAYARVYYAQGDFGRAMDHSEKSLAVTDPALGPYQCVAANMLGRALCASGHFGPSIEVLRRGCQLARDGNDLVELAHSEGLLGTALAYAGEFASSLRHIEESKRLAELLDNPARRMGLCLYQTMHAEAAFRWDDGLRSSAQLLAHADEYAMAGLYLYLGTLMAGRHHFHIGELRRARHLLANSINLSTIFGIRIGTSWAHAFLGDVHFIEGRIDEAVRWYATAHELARTGRGDGYGLPLALIGMAHAEACRGTDLARVSELADEAFLAFEAASNLPGLAVALTRYLEALALYRDSDLLASAVRGRLDEALVRIDAASCEFWPARPATATAAERALSLPEYWRQRAHGEIAAAAETDETNAETGKLLVNLSTINGFIPAFAVRQVP